mgnify:CR=1 FL=1
MTQKKKKKRLARAYRLNSLCGNLNFTTTTTTTTLFFSGLCFLLHSFLLKGCRFYVLKNNYNADSGIINKDEPGKIADVPAICI